MNAPRFVGLQPIKHAPLLCAWCGSEQQESVIAAPPPTPTVCRSCGQAVMLRGPIWMERLSELDPMAAGLGMIRMAMRGAA